jgi:enoyl-CoA hydratase
VENPSPASSSDSVVISAVHGPIGHIQLNRAGKLNALTLEMLTELGRVLRAWAADPSISLVLLTGRGEAPFAPAGILPISMQRSPPDGTRILLICSPPNSSSTI